MKISVLGSGSKGNSIFCQLNETKILIDIGFSYKQTKERLEKIGEDPENIQFILISHEHSDHIGGLEAFSAKHGKRFFISRHSLAKIKSKIKNVELAEAFEAGQSIRGNDFEICTFPLKHDSAQNTGFFLKDKTGTALLIYDTGEIPEDILKKYGDADILVIEVNHDVEMLYGSRYPWMLKKRILSEKGHLSNEQGFHVAERLSAGRKKLKYIFPVHISEENNHIELVRKAFHGSKIAEGPELVESYPDKPTKLVQL